MGKGSKQRLRSVSYKEYAFRWDYAEGKYPYMTLKEFKKKIKEIRNKL